jgi:hypothetical protein
MQFLNTRSTSFIKIQETAEAEAEAEAEVELKLVFNPL